MPDREECRPPAKEGGTQEDGAGGNVNNAILKGADDDVRELAEQLRRRREASLRLPPLADGYRDPLDKLRSAS